MPSDHREAHCTQCNYSFMAPVEHSVVHCPKCAATFSMDGDKRAIHVSGDNAEEVERVARSLAEDHAVDRNPPNMVDTTIQRAKNHPMIAVLVLVSIVVIGLAQFTDAIAKLNKHLNTWLPISTSLANLPGETGWIFAGYFDIEREAFIEGPHVSIISSNRRGMRKYAEIGDTIALRVDRKVIVVDFRASGGKHRLKSPISKGVIDSNDETGVVLPKSTELLVRDVSEGHWPDNPNAALWLRVVDVPQ